MSASLPRSYRILRRLVRLITRVFFKEIACEGIDRIPNDTGGLIVAWHPNGLVDPALILADFPTRIIFGARHGLFKWPIVGWLMRSVGTVPIYRAIDVTDKNRKERLDANTASLDALASELAAGSFSALFPEGLSHDDPHLSEIKTGAARLFYRAVELSHPGQPVPVIIPVGLHYDRKDIFRSRALVCFHEPLQLPPDLRVNNGEHIDPAKRRELCRSLTQMIQKSLTEVTRATANWDLHHLMHRLSLLVRAERAARVEAALEKPTIAERELGFARVWHAYEVRKETHPSEIDGLRQSVAEYDRDLRSVGLEDRELDQAPRLTSPLWIGLLLMQFVAVFLLFPPILLAGYIINLPPYYILRGISNLVSHQTKDSASVKIVGGCILFPAAWLGAGFLAAKAHHQLHLMFPAFPDVPMVAAVVTVILGISGGLLATIYSELSGETWRSVRVRLTRARHRDAIALLKRKRAAICEQVDRLMQGLSLPGRLAADGRITY